MLNADSPEITSFLRRWHDYGRAELECGLDLAVYDQYMTKTASTREKYIVCSQGAIGHHDDIYRVERTTGRVYAIHRCGVLNLFLGHIGHITDMFVEELSRRARGATA